MLLEERQQFPAAGAGKSAIVGTLDYDAGV